jgi:hypothetical protein
LWPRLGSCPVPKRWVGSGLSQKYWTLLERLSRYKHSSLIGLIVGDEEKRFYGMDLCSMKEENVGDNYI